jgi:hypothetical protein
MYIRDNKFRVGSAKAVVFACLGYNIAANGNQTKPFDFSLCPLISFALRANSFLFFSPYTVQYVRVRPRTFLNRIRHNVGVESVKSCTDQR